MKIYADTSVLFSLYATDAIRRGQTFGELVIGCLFLFLCFIELNYTMLCALRFFGSKQPPEQLQAIWADIENDIQKGLLLVRGGLWHRVFLEAESLSVAHTPTLGCRTLDVIHVAAAKLMGLTEFCTFDPRQAAIAMKIGLTVVSV